MEGSYEIRMYESKKYSVQIGNVRIYLQELLQDGDLRPYNAEKRLSEILGKVILISKTGFINKKSAYAKLVGDDIYLTSSKKDAVIFGVLNNEMILLVAYRNPENGLADPTYLEAAKRYFGRLITNR